MYVPCCPPHIASTLMSSKQKALPTHHTRIHLIRYKFAPTDSPNVISHSEDIPDENHEKVFYNSSMLSAPELRLSGPLLTMMVMTSYRVSAAAMVVCSALVS